MAPLFSEGKSVARFIKRNCKVAIGYWYDPSITHCDSFELSDEIRKTSGRNENWYIGMYSTLAGLSEYCSVIYPMGPVPICSTVDLEIPRIVLLGQYETPSLSLPVLLSLFLLNQAQLCGYESRTALRALLCCFIYGFLLAATISNILLN